VDRLSDFTLDEDDFVDWLQTGCFRFNLETHILHHQPSGIEINISSIAANSSPNWTIEQNFSTKNAKLKHLDTGAIWPIVNLFREQGHVLKGKVKPTYIRQTPATLSTPTPALTGGRTPEKSTQRNSASNSRTPDGRSQTSRQHGKEPDTDTPRAEGRQSRENVELVQGRDGRYRLEATPPMHTQNKSNREVAVPGVTPKFKARAAKQHQGHEWNQQQAQYKRSREQSPSLSPRRLSSDFYDEEEDEARMEEWQQQEGLQTQALNQESAFWDEEPEWESKSKQSERSGFSDAERDQQVSQERSDDDDEYAAESSEGELSANLRHGSHFTSDEVKKARSNGRGRTPGNQQPRLKMKVNSKGRVPAHISQPRSPSQKRRRLLRRRSSGN
jgi:hypothetical protein